MNSITWALYFIGVLPNISGLFMAFALIGSTLYAVYLVTVLADKEPSYREEDAEYMKNKGWLHWPVIIFILISFFFSMLIPDRTTMYAMVASEATEVVAETEVAQKTFDNLMDTINYQLCVAQGKENCSQ